MIRHSFIPYTSPANSPLVGQRPAADHSNIRPLAADAPAKKPEQIRTLKDGDYLPAIPDEASLASMAEAGFDQFKEPHNPSDMYRTVASENHDERRGSLVDLFV